MDTLHPRKIDLSDEVFVVNWDGYIGDSTRSEIEYAKRRRIKIRYIMNESMKDEIMRMLLDVDRY